MTTIFAFAAKYLLIFPTFHVAISLATASPYDGINEYQDEYKLPPLQFGYEELQPLLEGATIRVHHTGHHAAYTRKMNGALREWRADPDVRGWGWGEGVVWLGCCLMKDQIITQMTKNWSNMKVHVLT